MQQGCSGETNMKPALEHPIRLRKRTPRRAFEAVKWFAKNGPPDAPALPICYDERETLKIGSLPHIVAWFASSLECRDFNFEGHPWFEDYARGVLASAYAPDFITQDPVLAQRFPPRALRGLGPGLVWRLDYTPASIRHANVSQQKSFMEGPPPVHSASDDDFVPRDAANIPDSYAPWAKHFLCVSDEFIARATRCAPYKRLPRKWSTDHPGESFSQRVGNHELTVRAADHGWVIQRCDFLSDKSEVLAHSLLFAPVLCPTYATAARLAEACHPDSHPRYFLTWYDFYAEVV
jgi:hypothetical protein